MEEFGPDLLQAAIKNMTINKVEKVVGFISCVDPVHFLL
jgi:hypothetical protein